VHLILAPGLLDALVRDAERHVPQESCGLVAGTESIATRFIPVTNRLASPTEFDMEPAELIAALRTLRENQESLLAICHSHPRGPAMLSPRDIERANYPRAAHLVISLASAENPVVRGFRIIDGAAVEIELRAIV
jgi:proteasome lid subunit RPN8/RPN11